MQTPETEPTRLDRIEALIDKNAIAIEKLTQDIEASRQEARDLGMRFGYHQQSTQAIVNLAFSLVASATVAVFVSTVIRR
jgi:hypothetical protein